MGILVSKTLLLSAVPVLVSDGYIHRKVDEFSSKAREARREKAQESVLIDSEGNVDVGFGFFWKKWKRLWFCFFEKKVVLFFWEWVVEEEVVEGE